MTDTGPIKSVTVEYSGGNWWAVIVENGEAQRQSFETQEHAENYAAGQRVRLGLDS